MTLFQDYSLLNDFSGFTVAARRLRKVTTAMVTPHPNLQRVAKRMESGRGGFMINCSLMI